MCLSQTIPCKTYRMLKRGFPTPYLSFIFSVAKKRTKPAYLTVSQAGMLVKNNSSVEQIFDGPPTLLLHTFKYLFHSELVEESSDSRV